MKRGPFGILLGYILGQSCCNILLFAALAVLDYKDKILEQAINKSQALTKNKEILKTKKSS